MRAPLLQATLVFVLLVAGCGTDSSGDPIVPNPQALPDGLWIAGSGGVLRLAPDQLASSGNSTPATTVTTPSISLAAPGGMALDADGTVWLASTGENAVIALAPASLGSSGAVTARTTITAHGGSLEAPVGLAFDRDHRLWVANPGNGTIVRFDRDQLAAGGDPVPAVVLAGFENPYGLAFDADGALWVTDPGTSKIAKLAPAQLAVSGSPTPAVVLSSTNHSIDAPGFPAFDDAGNLWVPSIFSASVTSFTRAQLAATGSPVPHVVLSDNRSLSNPIGLAFDGDGSLWVTNNAGQLVKFDRAALQASGAPSPSVHLALPDAPFFRGVAFWPKVAGLPLN